MASSMVRNNVVRSGVPGAVSIVFAHGFGCDQSMWRLVTPYFDSAYDVITFDHVGFGQSSAGSWNAERYADLQSYANDLLDVLRELDLRDVVFVGHSVAAMIGVLASLTDPSRFAKLVLVGPSPCYIDEPETGYRGGFSRGDIDELLETLDSNYMGWSRQMAPMIMGNSDRPGLGQELTSSFCRVPTPVAELFARVTFLSDTRPQLDLVTVPTLILQCSEDVIAPQSVGRYVHEHIAGSTFVQLEATGHCPNLSAPAETARIIRDYLAANPLAANSTAANSTAADKLAGRPDVSPRNRR